MQPRPVPALQAELHGSSGAKKRRHHDDSLFTTSCWASQKRCPFTVVYRNDENAIALRFAAFNEHEFFRNTL